MDASAGLTLTRVAADGSFLCAINFILLHFQYTSVFSGADPKAIKNFVSLVKQVLMNSPFILGNVNVRKCTPCIAW